MAATGEVIHCGFLDCNGEKLKNCIVIQLDQNVQHSIIGALWHQNVNILSSNERLTIEEAAEYLNCSTAKLKQYSASGDLVGTQVGKRKMYTVEELERFRALFIK
ncbi:helix-turn-helix domain-containing protein [Lentisphaerota bacterium WC36G]|nr:helix-turn-helix domain-containing protein [Lentisphaerae bacterium WC36]